MSCLRRSTPRKKERFTNTVVFALLHTGREAKPSRMPERPILLEVGAKPNIP